MKQYLDIVKKIIDEGVWVENKRTGTKCKMICDETITINVGKGEFPILTTRKINFRGAIGEMIAYLRGYDNVEQFHKLGVKTWDANANNPVWLDSIYRRGEGDLGKIYGAAGNSVPHLEYSRLDPSSGKLVVYPGEEKTVLLDIIEKIKKGEDDRGLIWNFWNPSLHHLGCLRPCMYSHQFTLIGDTLHLSSTMRSTDTCLGLGFNLIQVYFLLWVMAKLTGKKPGIAKLRMVNIHIYENQYEVLMESKQHEREPYNPPGFYCNKEITLESVLGLCENEEDNLHPKDFELINYIHHPVIKYPFTV